MRKVLHIIISLMVGAAIGAIGAYFSMYMPEEKLTYSLSEPAVFDKVRYQNLEIYNKGWNPSEHVQVRIKNYKGNFKFFENPKFDLKKEDSLGIGGYKRIRRDEKTSIAIVTEQSPIAHENIDIKSNRMIARQISQSDFKKQLFSFLGGSLIGVLIFIALFLYYVKSDIKKLVIEEAFTDLLSLNFSKIDFFKKLFKKMSKDKDRFLQLKILVDTLYKKMGEEDKEGHNDS